MLHFGIATPLDISIVIEKLWDRGVAEAERFGFKSHSELLAFLTSAATEHGYVLKIEEMPVAVFGARHLRDNIYSTWFMATGRFDEAGAPITRFLRGFIREKLDEHPGAKIELSSAVDHPEADRWFKVLGFHPAGQPQGLFRRYDYKKG